MTFKHTKTITTTTTAQPRSEASFQVEEFHDTFDVPVRTTNFNEDTRRLQLRIDLVKEEARELDEAGDDAGRLDALGDLVYVCYGMAIEAGWDLDEAIRRIHASNMSKVDPEKGVLRRADGKILKGSDFKAPQLEDLVG